MLRSSFQKTLIEAGCDEAGRGCLAGPVYAAAVILPRNFRHKLLNDSKQLTEKERYELRPIIEKKAIAWAIACIEPGEIDRINILRAAFMAMHAAVAKLSVVPELLLIDGNRFTPYAFIPHQCIIQGDALYASIAAASVLAKTYRDDHMNRLHLEHPLYGWDRNKGYATKEHQEALNLHGPCVQHRRSFRLDYSKPLLEDAAQETTLILPASEEALILPQQEIYSPGSDLILNAPVQTHDVRLPVPLPESPKELELTAVQAPNEPEGIASGTIE